MYQIVKFVFPFANDFDKGKPRPSLVVSPSFGKHNQLILAYITTDLTDQLSTDIYLDSLQPYFRKTGLRSTSLVKLHRLITVTPHQIGQIIGILPETMILQVKKRLRSIFQLN